MFTTQSIQSFAVVIAAGVLSAAAIATPAQAADPAVGTSSVMNQSNSVYQETLKFYLHPARLAVAEESRPMMDHPAVIVAKTKKVPSDYTATFTLHPAVVASKPTQPLYGSAAKFIPSRADE